MERGVAFIVSDKDYERHKICPTELLNVTSKSIVFHRGTTPLAFINRSGKFTNMFPKFRSKRTHSSYKLINIKG